MSVYVREGFEDWDKKMVRAGTYEGAYIVRMGYAQGRGNWFWNIIQDGNAVAVTLGHPPHTVATSDPVRK